MWWQPPDERRSTSMLAVQLKMPPPRSSSTFVARKVVRHARNFKSNNVDKMLCWNCKLLPKKPITGRCGHTRCFTCVKKNGACPCGVIPLANLHSNIVVRDIVEKMVFKDSLNRLGGLSANAPVFDASECSLISYKSSGNSGRNRKLTLRSRLLRMQPKVQTTQTLHTEISLRRVASSPLLRFEHARGLLSAGRNRDAAAHFAHVAVASPSVELTRLSRDLLARTVAVLGSTIEPARLTRTLYRSVRMLSHKAWIDPGTIECPVCYDIMDQPVTTTCGHTFCRCCIKRTMQDRNMCPLCSSSLSDFYLHQTEDTEFMGAVLENFAANPPIVPNFIPIFACTVAFPDIPCPLMIFENDFQIVIKSILDSGSRRFGMLASLGDDTYANFGTMVEVKDCILFEDGRSILTTVGISRFRVLEKATFNGCPYARIQEHADIVPASEVGIFDLQVLAQQIYLKVHQWLPTLDEALRADIASSFGNFPEMDLESDWWDNPNGPIWLWWLIAILPLRTEIQMLMLSTRLLSKRMTAVLRTLHAMHYYTYVYRIV